MQMKASVLFPSPPLPEILITGIWGYVFLLPIFYILFSISLYVYIHIPYIVSFRVLLTMYISGFILLQCAFFPPFDIKCLRFIFKLYI